MEWTQLDGWKKWIPPKVEDDSDIDSDLVSDLDSDDSDLVSD